MSWEDVIGHGWAIAALRRQLQADRLRQAYLFLGPAGVGKATLAYAFVRAILCPESSERGSACGKCDNCRQSGGLAHPDLHRVQVESDASAIGVEQVRALQAQISLSPYQASRRAVVIEEAPRLTHAASNALLKTLEEPPPKVILILLAESVEQLLPTIASRCTQIPLRTVARAELEQELRERCSASGIELAAALAAGRPEVALGLLENDEALATRRQDIEMMFELLGAALADRFAYVNKALDRKSRKENADVAGKLLAGWLSLWRDVQLVQNQAGQYAANRDVLRAISAMAEQFSRKEVLHAVAAIRESLAALDRNANPELALAAALLDFPTGGPKVAAAS